MEGYAAVFDAPTEIDSWEVTHPHPGWSRPRRTSSWTWRTRAVGQGS
jgi:hypothetical protein